MTSCDSILKTKTSPITIGNNRKTYDNKPLCPKDVDNSGFYISNGYMKRISEVHDVSQGFIDEKTKELGVSFKYEAVMPARIRKVATCKVLKALEIAKQHFRTRSQVVVFTNDMGAMEAGYFTSLTPASIQIRPNSADKLFEITIHETVHQADIPNLASDIILSAIGAVFVKMNKSLINSEVSKYASTSRNEFVACMATKLITEGKTWDDVPKGLQKLYKILLGPKLKFPTRV